MERNTQGGNGVLEALEECIRREITGAELPEGVAGVSCVIISFHAICANVSCPKVIYDGDKAIPAKHINGYLMDAADAYIDCPKPVCEGVEKMTKGSQPTDGGNLSDWSDERRQEVITRYPAAEPMFRLITGSDEFINKVTRWCLWLKGVSPSAIRAVPPVMEAVERTRQMRLASKKPSTREWAKKPTLFTKGCHIVSCVM